MRWLKHVISLGLILAAAGVALSTGLSDHSHDYAKFSLPQTAVVHLPSGSVTIYYHQVGDSSDPIRQLSAPLALQVAPAGGGPAVPLRPVNGSTPAVAVQRSETIGELGAVAKLDVPASGEYAVTGTTDLPPGSSYVELGTNAGAALVAKWHLLAGLLLGALLVSLIPVPKHKRRWDDETGEPRGWSSDSRAPYAG